MSVYAFSDLHAQYDLWQQIKEYIKPDDTVYCLGDCVDRGDAGLEILNEILETPNIILLRGNHEDFIYYIGSELIKHNKYDYNVDMELSNLIYLWESNGAKNTIKAFKKLSKSKQWQLINKIKELPTYAKYINTKGDKIFLCHAGCRPDAKEEVSTKTEIPTNNYIWDRLHIYDLHWKGKDNEYCVHGHTPIEYIYYFLNSAERSLPQSRFEIFKYCDNHKIDIDLGSFETHKTCLLNLDTFKPIYFKDRTISKEEWIEIEEGVI